MTSVPESKVCSACGLDKPAAEYHVQKSTTGERPDRLQSRCKLCHNAAVKASRDPERAKLYQRARNLKHKYGMTIEQYDSMLLAQGRCCAICKSPTSRSARNGPFAVDHDHSCCPGERSCGSCIRGLVCYPCNQAIGLMGDSPDRLEEAARYLRTASLGG